MARISSILAALALVALGLAFAAVAFVYLAGVYTGAGFPVDFSAFWAEARLVLEGRAIDGYDGTTLNAEIAIDPAYPQTQYLWLYPPTWAATVAPLGLLPFWAAWPLFAGTCLWLYLRTLDGPAAALPGGTNLLLAAPVAVMGTLNGNNGLLSAAVLVLALGALDNGRAARGGLLIAALTMKPTLGLLIPFAMATAGWWRAVAWATAGALVLVGMSVGLFGVEMWAEWFRVLVGSSDLMGNAINTHVMVSWYGFGRSVGLDHETATAIQGVVTLGCVALTVWLFRTGPDRRTAVFLMAVPLATPYAHYYEMALTLAGVVFWIGAGGGRRWDERAVVALLWLLPSLAIFSRDPPLVALTAAPLMSLALGMALWRR
ncbi:MAG: glycosyltransferase family 87 protein [Pseudomonadota bacterium]